MIKVSPYFNFAGNTEEAFEFYRSVFGGEFAGVTRFGDMPDSMGASGVDRDRIANIGLPLGDSMLMATDVLEGWRPLVVGNNVYITLEVDTPEEADRLFEALSAGGAVEMPLQRTEWAEKYGACADRFGIQWMVMYTGSVVFEHGAGAAEDATA